MVGKGILVGTEALVYFKLVSQDWTYQPSCYDEFDFSDPMEYRHVYCEKDEEPPWLMVAMPPQSHCIPTSSSIDEPVSSTVWYTNPSPRLTKKTVPIYNLNKKFRLMNLGEKFSSASETNNRRALVGTANQPVLENTQWCTHQGYPHVSLPRVPPPGSECVSRGRPDTGPNKPVAVLRRLKHSFLQDHKCFKLEDDTTRLIDSDQWQLIKVLVLQDLINVMLPLLQQEEGREEGPDQPRAAQQHICLDTFPHNNSRDHNHSTNPCNNSSRDHNQSTNPCNINNSRRFPQSIEACTSSRQQHQSSTDEETQTANQDHTTSCSYASEKHEQHSKSKDSSFFTLQGFPCCCCDASGSVSPMSQDTGTPQSRVNDTRAALMHIFNIEQEEFSNVYYNILEMRCYHHVLLVTVCEGGVLPIVPPHKDDHQGGVDLTSCIVRYVSRTADTKGVHRMVSTSSSLFSMLNAQHITEESDQTDLHEVAIKPSKPGSKILKNVKRQFAKKRPHLSKLSPQQDSSKWFTQDASSPRSLQEASSPQPSLDASSSLFSYDASSLKSGQDASSPRSLQDAYSPQSLQDASSRLLSYNTQSVGSPRIASSESLSDTVHFHRASEDVLCTAETDRAETTSSGGTWQAAWEQTFLCLSDSTVNSWLDFEIRNRSVTNKPSDGPCDSTISKRGLDDTPPLAGHDEDDGSLGHTTLSLKNLETSAAEKNITLILSEKPDSSFITELENLVEPETPSKVDLEDPSTTHPAARSHLTGAKKKNVLNKIKSKTKKLTKQPFFHRKPNLTDKDIQIIQELPDDPLFNNSSEQTLDKRVQTESVSEQTNISTGIGQSANIVGNKLLEASSPTEESDVTLVDGRRIPRPHSLHLAENGVTLAHCSIDQAQLRVSLAGRQPRIKQFHCPLTPRVVIYLIHEAEIKCRWSETLPNTPFRGVVAPPLQPVVEAVRGASGLSQAQWAQLLLTDLLALLKEPQTSHANDKTRQSSHGGRSSEFTLTGTGPGRWCPNPNWCRRAGRAIDFGYVQSLFTESKVQDGRTNVDEKNIELSESWLELCKVLLRGLLAAFSDTSCVIGTLQLENCTRLAQWLCRDVSSSSSGRVTEMAARGRLLDALVDHDIAWWVVVMECYTEHDFEDVPVSQSKNSDHKEQSNPISARKGASTTVASTTEKLLRTHKKGSQSSMKEPNPKSLKINANAHPRKSCGSAATAKTSGMSSSAPRSSRGKIFRSLSKKRHHSGANKNDIHVKTKNFFKKMQVFSRKQKPELRVDAAATKLNAEARAATKLEKMAQMAEHVLRHLRSISKEYSPIFERNLSILYFDAVYDVIIKKFMFWLQLELTKVFALADISTEPLTFSDCTTDTEQSCDLSNQDQLNNRDLTEAGHFTQKEAKQLETDGWVIINSPCFDKCNGATNNMAHPPGAAGASSVWYIEEESSTQSTLLPTQVNQHSAVALLGTNTPMGHIYRTVKKILRLKEQHVKQQLRDTLPSFGGFGTSPSILSNIISQSCPYIAENSQNSPLFSPSSLFPDVSNSVCSSSMYLQVEDTSVVMQPESAVDVTLESVVDCVNKTRRNSSHVKFSAVELDKASVDMNGNKSKVDHSNVTSKDQTLKRNKECPRTVDKPSLFSGMLQNTKRKVCNERDLSLIVQEPIQSESLNDSSKVPDHSNHDMNDDHCISTRHDDELVYGNDSSLHALSNTVLRVYSVLRFNSNIMNIFKKWLLPVLLGTIKTYLSNAEKILSNDEEKDDFASKLIHMPCASEQVLMASSNSLGSTKFGRVPSAHDVTLNNGFLASEMTIDMRNIRISSSAIDLQDTVFILMNSWKKLDWHDTLAKDSDMTRPAVINTDKHDRPLNMRKEKTKELSANHKQSLSKQSGLKHQNKLKKGLIIAARKMVVENLPGNKIVSSLPMLDFSSAASIHPKQSEQISETKLFSDQELPLVADEESPTDLSQPIKKKEFAYLTNVKKKITSAYPTTKNNIFSKKTPPRTSDVTATSDASDASHKKEDTLDENVVDDLVEQVSSRFFAQTDQSSKVTALDPGTILMKELSSLCLRYCRRVHDKLLQMKPWNHDDQKTKMCVGLNNIAETMAILRQVPDHLCAGDTKSRSNLVDALDTIGNVGHSVLHHLIQERTVAVEESVVQCCVDRSSMPVVEGALYDDFILMKEHLTRPFFAFYRTKTYDIVRNKLADTKKPPKDASYGMNCDELEQAFRDFFDVDG